MATIKYITPFQHFCTSIGELPTSYLESLSYWEMLRWFCNFLETEVIPTVNNNSQVVVELQQKFIELKNYVDNYFNNLDIQEELYILLQKLIQTGQIYINMEYNENTEELKFILTEKENDENE